MTSNSVSSYSNISQMQFSKIRTKKDVLMQYLLKYFEDENKISIVEKIVTGKSNLY